QKRKDDFDLNYRKNLALSFQRLLKVYIVAQEQLCQNIVRRLSRKKNIGQPIIMTGDYGQIRC
ncbi:MAG TPA: hypothetical protein PLN86_16705, partial [Candidatus Hydrogenedentes bacterium]|nr:hypothetical protein [Candidatus Hydrogenedentota bacterium]